MGEEVFAVLGINDNECNIIGYKGDFNITELTIPSVIQGKKVNRVGFLDKGRLLRVRKVVISKGVKGISPNGFRGMISLSEVIIPSSVEYIGEGAFYGCQLERKPEVTSKQKKQLKKRKSVKPEKRDSVEIVKGIPEEALRKRKIKFFNGDYEKLREVIDNQLGKRSLSIEGKIIEVYVDSSGAVYISQSSIGDIGIIQFCMRYHVNHYEMLNLKKEAIIKTKRKKKEKSVLLKGSRKNSFFYDRKIPGARSNVKLFH